MMIKRTRNQVQIGRLIAHVSRPFRPSHDRRYQFGVGFDNGTVTLHLLLIDVFVRWETDEDRARAARWEAQREELRRRSETAEAF